MILSFQTPPLKPGRTAAGFPLQESSNLWALQSQPAASELGNVHIKHAGKAGSQPGGSGLVSRQELSMALLSELEHNRRWAA